MRAANIEAARARPRAMTAPLMLQKAPLTNRSPKRSLFPVPVLLHARRKSLTASRAICDGSAGADLIARLARKRISPMACSFIDCEDERALRTALCRTALLIA